MKVGEYPERVNIILDEFRKYAGEMKEEKKPEIIVNEVPEAPEIPEEMQEMEEETITKNPVKVKAGKVLTNKVK